MDFSLWPAPIRSWADIAARLVSRTMTGGTGSGSPTTTCRTPRTVRSPTATPTSAGRSFRRSPRCTDRVRLGSLVSPTTVHHPAVLANRIVDDRSHLERSDWCSASAPAGRSTSTRRTASSCRVPGERVAAVRRGDPDRPCACSTSRGPRSPGAYYTITDAPCEPKPIQSPLPILVGTGGSRMMRITARHADEWNTWGDIDDGDDEDDGVPGGVRRGRSRPGDDAPLGAGDRVPGGRRRHARPAARERARRAFDRRIAVGVGRRHRPVRDLGFDEFIVPEWNLGRDLDQRLAKIERFRTEVVSHLT